MTSFLRAPRAGLAAAAAAVLAPSASLAASPTATGIDGSFITMLSDLDGMLGGNFGALLLLVSLIIGVGIYAVTSRFQYMIASLIVAFLVGYGVDIVQGIGGVTATVDLLDPAVIADLAVTPAATVLPAP